MRMIHGPLYSEKNVVGRKECETIVLSASDLCSTQLQSERNESNDCPFDIVLLRVQRACDEIERKHASSNVHIDRNLNSECEIEDQDKGRAGRVTLHISVGSKDTLLYLGNIRVRGTKEAIVEIELKQSMDCPVASTQILSIQGVLATLKQHLQRSNRRWRREMERASSGATVEKKMIKTLSRLSNYIYYAAKVFVAYIVQV